MTLLTIRYVVLILIIDSLIVFLILTHQLFTPWVNTYFIIPHGVSLPMNFRF